ncbi:MAG: hypothetical protein ICV68_04220 [Pyrinomonadaceae bacterium]|nr:hypothetical protein [Pyrinomonadaceae bacterium]
MKISDLPLEVVARLEQRQYDQIINKHEGPETWHSLTYYEFINCNQYEVLLPIEKDHHPKITIRRVIVSDDYQSLTIFLEDTTYDEDNFAGRVAICNKFEDQPFFVAILYHECFIIEN